MQLTVTSFSNCDFNLSFSSERYNAKRTYPLCDVFGISVMRDLGCDVHPFTQTVQVCGRKIAIQGGLVRFRNKITMVDRVTKVPVGSKQEKPRRIDVKSSDRKDPSVLCKNPGMQSCQTVEDIVGGSWA